MIPQTFDKKGEDVVEYGDWGHDGKKVGPWLPQCLRDVRSTYSTLIQLDLPTQALDIVKRLSTDMRLQCLQMIFQTVIDEVHLLHEKEEWKQVITGLRNVENKVKFRVDLKFNYWNNPQYMHTLTT